MGTEALHSRKIEPEYGWLIVASSTSGAATPAQPKAPSAVATSSRRELRRDLGSDLDLHDSFICLFPSPLPAVVERAPRPPGGSTG